MKTLIKRILHLGLIVHSSDNQPNARIVLTGWALYIKLKRYFRKKLMTESIGNRLSYPMSFEIQISSVDYEIVKESFPDVVKAVVTSYYSIINRQSRRLRFRRTRHLPPATYWFFQFYAKDSWKDADGNHQLSNGDIHIESKKFTKDQEKIIRKKADDDLSLDTNKARGFNMNIEAYRGIEILDEGTYKVNFNMTKIEGYRATSISPTKSKAMATLKWFENGVPKEFNMLDSSIIVSGLSDPREARNICKIASDKVERAHVLIRFDKTKNEFQIAVYAPTILNNTAVRFGKTNTVWMPLPNNSMLLLNNSVKIKFKVNNN